MPANHTPQTVTDFRQGGFEFGLNVGAGLPDLTVSYVLRDPNSVNTDRISEPTDLGVLTQTERNNLAAILKKLGKIAAAAKLNVADPQTLIENPNWVFTEP